MTPQDVIDDVRILINDTTTTYRYSDAALLKFVNEAMRRIALLRPDLFSTFGTVSCAQNEVLQAAPTGSFRLMEVFRIQGGNAVVESNRETMDQNLPTWPSDTAAAASIWMRHPRDPNKFFIYPKAPSSQVLEVEYAVSPAAAAIDGTLALPDAYFPALVDCVVFLSQSIDNEHVNSGRAKLFYDSFTQVLGVGNQAKTITDVESGGLPEEATV